MRTEPTAITQSYPWRFSDAAVIDGEGVLQPAAPLLWHDRLPYSVRRYVSSRWKLHHASLQHRSDSTADYGVHTDMA